jgi:hypothetical protein
MGRGQGRKRAARKKSKPALKGLYGHRRKLGWEGAPGMHPITRVVWKGRKDNQLFFDLFSNSRKTFFF